MKQLSKLIALHLVILDETERCTNADLGDPNLTFFVASKDILKQLWLAELADWSWTPYIQLS